VAVVGSVFSSVYVSGLGDGQVVSSLPIEARQATEEFVGAAQVVAGEPGGAAPQFLTEVSDAFLSGLGAAGLVVAGVAAAGSVFALR